MHFVKTVLEEMQTTTMHIVEEHDHEVLESATTGHAADDGMTLADGGELQRRSSEYSGLVRCDDHDHTTPHRRSSSLTAQDRGSM